MSSGTFYSASSGFAAVSPLASLGAFPLLGCAFTGFVLGGLLGFGKALACVLLLAAAGSWVRMSRRRAARSRVGAGRGAPDGRSHNLVAAGIVTLWGLANIALYASVLLALCGDAWFWLFVVGAGLAWLAGPLRYKLPGAAAGISLLAFHPICLGLIASCVQASTWPQLLATAPRADGLWPTLSSVAWVALAVLASEWHGPGFGAMSTTNAGWRVYLAECLLLKLPATFMGLLAGLCYYDAHGFGAGFVQTLSWVLRGSTFCARWFVAVALMAGLLALMHGIFGFLQTENRGAPARGSCWGVPEIFGWHAQGALESREAKG